MRAHFRKISLILPLLVACAAWTQTPPPKPTEPAAQNATPNAKGTPAKTPSATQPKPAAAKGTPAKTPGKPTAAKGTSAKTPATSQPKPAAAKGTPAKTPVASEPKRTAAKGTPAKTPVGSQTKAAAVKTTAVKPSSAKPAAAKQPAAAPQKVAAPAGKTAATPAKSKAPATPKATTAKAPAKTATRSANPTERKTPQPKLKGKAVVPNVKPPARTESQAAGLRPGIRRDPFLSPVVKVGTSAPCTTGGKKCLSIGEIVLKGVAKTDNGMLAIVENAARKAYFLRENDPVFNGVVVRITMDQVVLRENVMDHLGHQSTRDVIKRITPSPVG